MAENREGPVARRERARIAARKSVRQTLRRLLEELEVLPNPEARVERWQQLAGLMESPHLAVGGDLVRRLLKMQAAERVDDVWRAAANTIAIAQLALKIERGRQEPGRRRPEGLGAWYREPLREPQARSWILWAANPQDQCKVAHAVIQIVRSLPLVDYPLTSLRCVDPEGFAPGVAELDEVVALCFVGRLWMGGGEVARRWGMVGEPRRYCFAMNRRPANWPAGKLHRRYHAIVKEADSSSGKRVWYRARQDRETRTDYGLVWRYVVRVGDCDHVVLAMAGTSSLGTHGAAHFAAHHFFSDGVGKGLFPLPPRYSDDSRLEALVEVTAPLKGSNPGWELKDLKLIDLRFDEYIWTEDEPHWELPTLRQITVKFPSEYARRNFRSEEDALGTTVYFADRETTARKRSENRRLIIALCLLAKRHAKTVELEQLGRDRWIWRDGQTKDASYVRTRLNNKAIRQQFGGALVLEGNECRLTAEIRIEIGTPTSPK